MSNLLLMRLSARAMQRAANVMERLFVVRFIQAQPVTAKTQSSLENSTDPIVSVFHRPTKISVDCRDICEKADYTTIYCRHTGEFVNVCFNDNLRESLHDVQQKITEIGVCSEASAYDYMSLPRLYSKLAKLRLTGILCPLILYVLILTVI